MTTLVVVDMQDHFMETAHKVVVPVCKEIKLAMEREAGIIIVEFRGFGQTSERIESLIEDYPWVARAFKSQDAGGLQVIEVAKKVGFELNPVRFCGVNRSYCVRSTVSQLQKNSRVSPGNTEIAIGATWCHDPKDGRKALKELGRFVS